MIDPDSLEEIRKQRLRTMRVGNNTNYGQLEYILAELEYAEDLFRKNRHWPVINVTQKALEETAGTIVNLYVERGLGEPNGEIGQL